MGLTDISIAIAAALAAALISEAISFLFIYRTDSYQNLKSTIEKLQKKLAKTKETGLAAKDKSKAKKAERTEEQMKLAAREFQLVKMKSMLPTALTMLTLIGLLNTSFDGVVVARLPFEPISLLTGISHRGLSGSDYREAGALFVYIVAGMAIRSSLQKLLGTTPPKTPDVQPFGPS